MNHLATKNDRPQQRGQRRSKSLSPPRCHRLSEAAENEAHQVGEEEGNISRYSWHPPLLCWRSIADTVLFLSLAKLQRLAPMCRWLHRATLEHPVLSRTKLEPRIARPIQIWFSRRVQDENVPTKQDNNGQNRPNRLIKTAAFVFVDYNSANSLDGGNGAQSSTSTTGQWRAVFAAPDFPPPAGIFRLLPRIDIDCYALQHNNTEADQPLQAELVDMLRALTVDTVRLFLNTYHQQQTTITGTTTTTTTAPKMLVLVFDVVPIIYASDQWRRMWLEESLPALLRPLHRLSHNINQQNPLFRVVLQLAPPDRFLPSTPPISPFHFAVALQAPRLLIRHAFAEDARRTHHGVNFAGELSEWLHHPLDVDEEEGEALKEEQSMGRRMKRRRELFLVGNIDRMAPLIRLRVQALICRLFRRFMVAAERCPQPYFVVITKDIDDISGTTALNLVPGFYRRNFTTGELFTVEHLSQKKAMTIKEKGDEEHRVFIDDGTRNLIVVRRRHLFADDNAEEEEEEEKGDRFEPDRRSEFQHFADRHKLQSCLLLVISH